MDLEKIRLSDREVLSPASVGRSGLAESDGLDRRAKFRGLEGLAVNRQRGLGRPCQPQDGKESCLSRRLSPTSDWFSESPCRTGKPGRAVGFEKVRLFVPEALADVRLVSESPCRTGKPR